MSTEPRFIPLKDGSRIDVHTGKRAVNTEINKAFTDNQRDGGKAKQSLDNVTRRFLDDLPVPSLQSRPLAIIAAYSVFGLSESDIAYLLNTDVENIRNVIASDAFNKFVEGMLQNVREHDLDVVRKKINESAIVAASKVTDLVGSRDEKVALAAAKDVLDRAGSGTYSNSGTDRSSTGFTIRIIDDKDNPASGVQVEVSL